MTTQDWNPVIIRKKPPSKTDLEDPKVLQAALREGKVEAIKKIHQSTPSSQPVNVRKIEKQDEEGNFKHERISEHLKKTIIKLFNNAKLTQAQLAQKINEKPQIIQEYENGKAIPSSQILNKLSRVFGVQLKKNSIVFYF
ncbi:DNA binding helix-turn helix protein [Dunaliella salina]|uniref:DNA binding helix-turn helix protein n=1 Tax=Dunaliella salina TaxID=3046 RepID=A0ABQ7FTV9_DUNSA|nr:DNA binding helix-turn helix protein [Dunaliella salina]|eukprot:KAF5825868.1 DNA binding helix-turn helix protein [Dunaliella salina]